MTPILIEFIHNFSVNEFKKFDRFIESPYFNTDKSLIKLYKFLKKHVESVHELSPEFRIRIYKQLFPDDRISANQLSIKQKGVLDATMGKLTALVKKFFAVEGLEQNKIYYNMLLCDKLSEKQHFRALERNLNKEQKELKTAQQRGIDYHFHEYQLEMARLNLLYRQGTILKADNLPELIHSFDTHYLIKKLDFQATALSFMGVSARKKYDFEVFDATRPLLELKQYATHPLIQVYVAAIRMMQTREEAAYDDLLGLLNEFEAQIQSNNLVDFYKIASIFCARRIREGKPEYHRHTFDLYKIMEQKNLLREGDFIPITKLKNIISISCHVGEFEWATEVLEMYKPFIRKPVRESVYQFNLGAIAFYRKNYRQAISHFIRVDKVDTNYDVNCRMQILKSYYELDEDYDERTMQQFRSTKRFIKENKSLKITGKQGWENFVSAAANLYKVRHQYGKITVERVQQQIDNFKSINDKRWLLEKMNELN